MIIFSKHQEKKYCYLHSEATRNENNVEATK